MSHPYRDPKPDNVVVRPWTARLRTRLRRRLLTVFWASIRVRRRADREWARYLMSEPGFAMIMARVLARDPEDRAKPVRVSPKGVMNELRGFIDRESVEGPMAARVLALALGAVPGSTVYDSRFVEDVWRDVWRVEWPSSTWAEAVGKRAASTGVTGKEAL